MGLHEAQPGTLAHELTHRPGAISPPSEYATHDAALRLAEGLLGVRPNVAGLLAIPTGQRRGRPVRTGLEQYAALVPALLRPTALLTPSDRMRPLITLVMSAAASGAGCQYCRAHTAELARRRGVGADLIRTSMQYLCRPHQRPALRLPGIDSAATWAALDVAYVLGERPVRALTLAQRAELEARFPVEADREYILAAIAMMRWLTTTCATWGSPLEPLMLAAAEDTIAAIGWRPDAHAPTHTTQAELPDPADRWYSKLRLAPAALRAGATTRRWLRGVPRRPEQIRDYLQHTAGTGTWPGLAALPAAAQRAVAAGIRDHLADDAPLSPATLHRIGVAVAGRADEHTVSCLDAMARHRGLTVDTRHRVTDPDPAGQLVLRLVDAAAVTPVELPATLTQTLGAELTPAQVAAAINWTALCAMLTGRAAWDRLTDDRTAARV